MLFQNFFDPVASVLEYVSQGHPSPVIKTAINGTDESDNVSGTPWYDTMTLYGGHDTISWSEGRDVIDGGAGEFDTLSYAGMQKPLKIVLKGEEFSDVFVEDVAATTTFYQEQNTKAEEEREFLKFIYGPDFETSFQMDPFTPTYLHKDLVRNVEKIIGGAKGDLITGDNRDNVFVGGPGEDILSGKGGADIFVYEHAYAPNDDDPSEVFTGNVDAILDFNRDEGDKIDLSGFATVGEGHTLTFVGEALTFEAETPWGQHTYSKNPEPYTINYEHGVDPRDNPVYGDSRFEDAEGNPLYKGEDGISLRIDYGGDHPFLITVWGVADIRESDLLL